MKKLGGNIRAVPLYRTAEQNSIGEDVESWSQGDPVTGWLDYVAGVAGYSDHSAKVAETTHVFLTDRDVGTPDKMLIGGKTYDVLYIDNPMEFGYHREIDLKLTEGMDGESQ